LFPAILFAQSGTDAKTIVLANTHGRVHDLIADMFDRDNSTLERWASDPARVPHADEMCTAGERGGLQALATNIRALNLSLPDASALSGALKAALRLETYQPSTRDQLKKTLTAVISAGNIQGGEEALKTLDQPAPAQVEVSREDFACHFIPALGSAEPSTNALGPTYEIVVGKDGKTKSATPYKIQGEIAGWQMAARRVRYRPFYFLGEPVEAKGLVTFKLNLR
jgi:hypothetical protein